MREIDEVLQNELSSHHYDYLDLQEEILEELSVNLDQYVEYAYLTACYHPLNRQFAFANPARHDADIVQCRNVFKSAIKGVKKSAKKIGHGIKKGAEKVAEFVKDHKKEILIGAALVAVGAGAYMIAGLAGGAAAVGAPDAPNKRREDEKDPESSDSGILPPPREVPPNENQAFISHEPSTRNKEAFDRSLPSLSSIDRSEVTPPIQNSIANYFESLRNGFNPSISVALSSSNEHTTESVMASTAMPTLPTNFQGIPSIGNLGAKETLPIQSVIATYFESLRNGFNPSVPVAPPINSEHTVQSVMAPISEFTSFLDYQGISSIDNSGILSITATQRAILNCFDSLKKEFDSFIPTSSSIKSCHVRTEGIKLPGMQIGFINGMNTSFEGLKSHLEHIKKFAGDLRIEGVYNNTNLMPVDLLEIFSLNYAGIAPITGDLLLENWTKFHEENKGNPDAKYLQIAHSMGTILTKATLLRAPKEIQDRVIVLAFGPAVIIPKTICYDSVHYASSDFVHYGEDVYTHIIAAFNDEGERLELLNQLVNNKPELVDVEPHPDAHWWGHDFQNITFEKLIRDHVEDYLNKKGKYK